MEGIIIPFIGTVLGSAGVFFMKKGMNITLQKILSGFAAGVMVAASIWSLLLPAIEQVSSIGGWGLIPIVLGFWMGIAFLLILEQIIPCLCKKETKRKNSDKGNRSTTMLVLAVVLHNIPEGMAVGVAYAGWKSGDMGITLLAVISLSIGIAIQNIPEGAIVSMPLRAVGMSKWRAFSYGVLSGIVEPIGAGITIIAAGLIVPWLPCLLSFAAGAMLYVVVEELIPKMTEGKQSKLGVIFFSVGFTIMMCLDVLLG